MSATSNLERSSYLTRDTIEARLVSSVVDALSGLTVPILISATDANPASSAEGVPRSIDGKREPEKRGDVAFATFEEGSLLLVEAKAPPNARPAAEHDVRRLIGAVIATTLKDAMRDAEDVAQYDPSILQIARVVERALADARRRASEAMIERILGALIETQDPVAKVSAEIDAANANARMRFVATFPTLSAEEIAERAGSKAQNRHQAASRWKGEGKIFSVPWQGLERFPAFQFDHGRPIPAVASALAALPDRMSRWEVAFWFVSTNGWLDGKSPHDELRDNPGRVVEAAKREAEAVVG
jgi:hypothetical protein